MTTERTLESVQETHSEMLATAADLGVKVPEELKADFSELQVGENICSALDTLIREHKKGLANDDGSGQTAQSTTKSKPAKKRAGAGSKTTRKSSSKKQADTAANPADVDPPNSKESTVAKTAKKTKTAKKAASANARKPAGGAKRSKFSEDAKITATGKANPFREGSGKFERVKTLLAHNGKTVKTYLGKGKSGTLAACVKLGLVKVA